MRTGTLTLALTALAGIAHAQDVTQSSILPTQGRLTDSVGSAVSGDHTLVVSLYGAFDATTPLYREAHEVSLAGGYYSVLIGTGDPVPYGFTNPDGLPDSVFAGGGHRWLGIAVDSGGELGPRSVIAGGLVGGGGPQFSGSCAGASDAGSLRWNDVQGRLEVCDGTNFTAIGLVDTTPEPFSFSDRSTGLSQVVESNSVTLTGFDESIVITVAGDGSPTMSINGGASWSTSASVVSGQSLMLRLTSADIDGQVRSATVSAPNYSTTWSVTSQELNVVDQHTAPGGQTVYLMEYRDMPAGDLRAWYRDACLSQGLAPVMCDYNNWGGPGGGYDARAWDAVILERNYWSCNVSSGVTAKTGWLNIITFHVPGSDNRGVCQNGCTINDSVQVAPICTDAP